MVRAWFMDDSDQDQRLPHHQDPPKYVTLDYLMNLGVEYWFFEPMKYSEDPKFDKLKLDRCYSYQDQIEVSPEKLDNYETKIKSFYDEHIHTDEEIRYILDGSGYFDVRDHEDNWIRIEVSRGDMIVLPAGIFHRFTLDTNNYIKALRLFIGEPVWTPHSRSVLSQDNTHVKNYREKFLHNQV